MTSLNLTLAATEMLPSQAGRKGRPRKHGRVRVESPEAPMLFVGEGRESLIRTLIGKLAEMFGVKPAEVAFYAHESMALSLSFIVKGTDANTVRTYSMTTEG